MGKPKQRAGSASHPRRGLPWGAVLGKGCRGTAEPSSCPHGPEKGHKARCEHLRRCPMLSPAPDPWQQGRGGPGRRSGGSSPDENTFHGAGVLNCKETLS